MPLRVIRKTHLPRGNLLLRLNGSDTRFFLTRLKEATQSGRGVNLILQDLSCAVCEIETPEHGREITVNAYSDAMTHRVESPMRGYNGPWSHAEIVMPLAAVQTLNEFTRQKENGLPRGSKIR